MAQLDRERGQQTIVACRIYADYILCCSLLWAGIAQQQPIAPRDSGCEQVKRSYGQEVVEIDGAIEAHELAGVVVYPSGPSIRGVAVEMIDSAERCLKAVTTDPRGRFNLGITKSGTYSLLLSLDGFNTVIAHVRVSPESKKGLRIELPPSN